MADQPSLTREQLARFDRGSMLDDVLGLPRHLRAAIAEPAGRRLPWGSPPDGVVVAGVGGAAVAGDLAAALLGPRVTTPVRTVRGYELGPGVGPDTVVVCLSYSGATDSTLACFRAGVAAGARVVAVTNGGTLLELARAAGAPILGLPAGFQPRAAIAYTLVSLLACIGVPAADTGLASAAAALDALAREWGPDAADDSAAKALARQLFGALPVVYGVGPTVAAAARWRTQLTETGKQVAFASDLVDAGHYEIAAWDNGSRPANAVAVFLAAEPDQHPDGFRRMRLTEQVLAGAGMATYWVDAPGETRAARLLALVLLGDLVSLYLAALRGADPSAIPLIARLNQLIASA